MKTKIIYISGNEVFNIAEIRAAFETVRDALNLSQDTVLFGVPVDSEDAGFATNTEEKMDSPETEQELEIAENPAFEVETIETITEITPKTKDATERNESAAEQPIKKRGRPRKEEKIKAEIEPEDEAVLESEEDIDETQESIPVEQIPDETEEKVVPILSVLSSNDDEQEETIAEDNAENDLEIIPEDSEIISEPIEDEIEVKGSVEDDEADLEKLLSAMTPLEEDIIDEQMPQETIEEEPVDISVDATLEQLATEFAENQDKIASQSKSSARSKIGKLRNILPFKQSKHKDQGLGDLFGWAGYAANDEDFSVPGFFTSAGSKK